MPQSAPEIRQWPKTDPSLSVRRSNTLPSLQGFANISSRPYETAPFQQSVPQTMDTSYRRGSQDPPTPSNPGSAVMTPTTMVGSVSAASPYTVQSSIPGLGVPDLSAVMFPSEDPFAYPNQPITTLENQQGMKLEGVGNVYNMNTAPLSGNTGYDNVNGQMFDGMPPYTMPTQSPGFLMQRLPDGMPMNNADAARNSMNFGQRWPAQAPNQNVTGTPPMPMDQLYGEDWGGWMNQGYRQ